MTTRYGKEFTLKSGAVKRPLYEVPENGRPKLIRFEVVKAAPPKGSRSTPAEQSAGVASPEKPAQRPPPAAQASGRSISIPDWAWGLGAGILAAAGGIWWLSSRQTSAQ